MGCEHKPPLRHNTFRSRSKNRKLLTPSRKVMFTFLDVMPGVLVTHRPLSNYNLQSRMLSLFPPIQ